MKLFCVICSVLLLPTEAGPGSGAEVEVRGHLLLLEHAELQEGTPRIAGSSREMLSVRVGDAGALLQAVICRGKLTRK